MMWLQPWAVWFLAGLPLIVMLYLLKVRRRAVSVSTLIFWQRVVQEHRRRALFQRLRSVLSLLLHLLIFALIVAALARPTFDKLVREGASTVLIVDRRARMNAVGSSGQTYFAKAVQDAVALVRDASPGRQFAVLTAGAESGAALPFSGNERALRTALDTLEPTDAGGALEPALQLASELLATRTGTKQAVLLTDRPLDPALRSRFPDLVIRAVGEPIANAGILRFSARPLPASPSTSEILLEAGNFSAEPLSTTVELRYDDRLLDVKPLTIQPGSRELLVFSSIPRPVAGARGHLTAKLTTKDPFPTDDLAHVWLPPPRPIRVLLITKGNVFLEKALSADPGVSYELLGPESWNDTFGSKFDVVLFDDFHPPAIPAANVFYLNQTPFTVPSETLELPPLTEIDSSHPTLRLIDFAQTTILRAKPLELPAPTDQWTYTVPLRSLDHALFVVGEQRGTMPRRLAALGLDLSATDLPLRVAFPLLITNTVHWLAGFSSETPSAIRAGEMLRLEPGEALAAKDATLRDFVLVKNGFYPIIRDGRSEWIAVNTFDEAESDFRHERGELSPVREGSPLAATLLTTVSAWPPWRYFALGALLLFTAEWALFHRRRTE